MLRNVGNSSRRLLRGVQNGATLLSAQYHAKVKCILFVFVVVVNILCSFFPACLSENE